MSASFSDTVDNWRSSIYHHRAIADYTGVSQYYLAGWIFSFLKVARGIFNSVLVAFPPFPAYAYSGAFEFPLLHAIKRTDLRAKNWLFREAATFAALLRAADFAAKAYYHPA